MEAVQFVGSLHKVEKRVDGSTRLTIECGLDSFEAVQEMERLRFISNKHFAFAVVAYHGDNSKDITIDEQTGEVKLNP